jgi:NapC/NirT cytochrome c family, N-terminal region
MKRYYVFAALIMITLIFSYCHSSKKAMTSVSKSTYETNIQALVVANCSPCHIPSKGGNKRALDTYAAIKDDIDDVIRRIELNPTDRGFMPFKHDKLSDSTIAVFKQWRTDGLMEK